LIPTADEQKKELEKSLKHHHHHHHHHHSLPLPLPHPPAFSGLYHTILQNSML
jgi:hypothetical protein